MRTKRWFAFIRRPVVRLLTIPAGKKVIIGTPVKLCSNDALDYESFGTIKSLSGDNKKCLIVLHTKASKKNMEFHWVVGQVRSTNDSFLGFLSSGEIQISATWIPLDKLGAAQQFDVSWWRGGLASSVTLMRA